MLKKHECILSTVSRERSRKSAISLPVTFDQLFKCRRGWPDHVTHPRRMLVRCSVKHCKRQISWFCYFFLFWWLVCEETNLWVNRDQGANQRYEKSPVPWRTKNFAHILCRLSISSWFHGTRKWMKGIKRGPNAKVELYFLCFLLPIRQ